MPLGILTFGLTDVTGRKIAAFSNEQYVVGKDTIQLRMPESLPKGTYFLKINNEKNTTTVKILK